MPVLHHAVAVRGHDVVLITHSRAIQGNLPRNDGARVVSADRWLSTPLESATEHSDLRLL